MHTSDKSARGEQPGRSSDSQAADSRVEKAARLPCGATTAKGKPCRKWAVKDGLCRTHIYKSAGAPAVPAVTAVPAAPEAAPSEAPVAYAIPSNNRELERLRKLQEAAERHAFQADRAIEEEGNGTHDAAFNRNARTAAALARTRHALAKEKADARRKKGKAALESVVVEMPGNDRKVTPPREGEGGPQPSSATDSNQTDDASKQ